MEGPPSISQQARDHKRRKIRKGTQSCWECKRRKIRCTFFQGSTVCDGCVRRGTGCVGQELPESASSSIQVGDRLGRLEIKVEQLTQKIDRCQHLNSPSAPLYNETHEELEEDHIYTISRSPAQSSVSQELPRSPSLLDQLTLAWPCERDVNALLMLSDQTTFTIKNSSYNIYSHSFSVTLPELLKLPSRSLGILSHARRGFMLAAFLQELRNHSSREVGGLSISCRDKIMSRLSEASHNLLVCSEEDFDSIEVIECLLLDSLYFNVAGNLKRSWFANRRAMSIGQLCRIDHDQNIEKGSIKSLWSRLLQMDSYLSLVLGLTPYLRTDYHESPSNTLCCSPLERIQDIHCTVASYILEPNPAKRTDIYEATMRCDRLLQEATRLMPPDWWVIPSSGINIYDKPEALRVLSLTTHSYMILRTHLQNFLNPSSDRLYDYSRISATNASRDIVSLYLSFRSSSITGSYCSGMDLLAFTACLVLSIAQIKSSCERSLNEIGAFAYLVHRRPADRDLLERTINIMESASHQDVPASTLCALKRICDVEANANTGSYYIIDLQSEKNRDYESRICDDDNSLLILSPIFGTIQFKQVDILNTEDLLINNSLQLLSSSCVGQSVVHENQEQPPTTNSTLDTCQIEWAIDDDSTGITTTNDMFPAYNAHDYDNAGIFKRLGV